MHAWEDCLTDVDRIVIEKGHYGQPRGFGKKPLLLIIDLQPNYIGADKPIEDQLDEWPSGGGEACWAGVRKILSLRDVARECGVPVFYTRNVQNATNAFDSFATKTKRDQTKYIDGAPEADLEGNRVVLHRLPCELLRRGGFLRGTLGDHRKICENRKRIRHQFAFDADFHAAA